jgi:hypothetical protein
VPRVAERGNAAEAGDSCMRSDGILC